MPGWTLQYRPDGQQVLFAGRGHGGLGEAPDQLSAAVTDARLSAMHHLRIDGLKGNWVYAKDTTYSGDGRFLAVSAESADTYGNHIDSAVAVWDVAALDRPVLSLDPMPSFAVARQPGRPTAVRRHSTTGTGGG